MPVVAIRHVTTYRYWQPVAFGEHRMMLRPRDSGDQRLLTSKLEITPEPRNLSFVQDAFGNHVGVARFSGRRAKELRFASTVYLEHSPPDVSCLEPVVATKVGGLPEMVEHGQTGYLVPPRNTKELADSITRLLLDAPLRHRMGANAKRKIEMECSPRAIAQKTLQAYRRAADRFPASGEKLVPRNPVSTRIGGAIKTNSR